MSWNIARTINNIQFDVSENTNDLEIVKNKTFHIDPALSFGTNFLADVYAPKYIVTGYTGQTGYLMSDGTITTSSTHSQQGQPNIYLYMNSNGAPANDPQSGQVRFDSISNTTAKHLFISVMTSDNININVFLSEISDVSIIYLQDKNSSLNWVRYTVQGITIYPAYVDINVTYLSSSGFGGGDFGGLQPIFMSIFDNSSLISDRITTLESKLQNESATSTSTTFSHNFNSKLATNENFIISTDSTPFALPKFGVGAEVDSFLTLNMNSNKILNVLSPTNGTDVSNKTYVDTSISSLNLSSTYLTQASAINTYLSKTSATGIYLSKSDASTIYATITSLSAYLTSASAGTIYLTKTDASSLYATLQSLDNYLLKTNATTIYLSRSDASNLYATLTSLNNYLLKSDASSLYATLSSLNNYLLKNDAMTTYLSKSDASSLYTPLSSLSNYLLKNDASSLYATITSLSAYLTSASAGTLYLSKSDASTIYATITSLSTYLTTANAVSTYATISSLANYLTTLSASNTYLTKTNATSTYATISSLANYMTTADGATKTFVDASVGTVSIQVQNLSATPTSNTILHNITNTLEFGESFKIQDNALSPIAQINNTDINFYRNQNLNAKNINNAGFITALTFIKSGGASTDFLKADGTTDSNTYVTTANVSGKLNIDGTNVMTGALNMGTTNKIINLATPTLNTDAVTKLYTDNADALKLNLSGGKMTGILDMGLYGIYNASSINSQTYTINGCVPNSVPWIDAYSNISTAVTNLYCQSGSIASLQTLIDNIQTNLGYSIQLSSGNFPTAITFAKQNVIICGTSCPLFAPSSTITNTLTIGSNSSIVTRLKVNDVVITGAVTFVSDATYQQCRYNFSNCEFQGNVVFPTAVNGTSPYIYFFDCTFSNVTAMTLPNTTCTIIFTRCVFNNQTMSVLAPYGYVTFRECTNMNSLSLPAVYYGVNALVNRTSALVASTVTANSISLGGASTSFLKGNGSLDNNTYSVITSSTVTVKFAGTNAGTGTNTDVILLFKKISDGTRTVVVMTLPAFTVTMSNTPIALQTLGSTLITSDLRPSANIYFPIAPIKNGSVYIANMLLIVYSSGYIGFTRYDELSTIWGAGLVCGPTQQTQYTWSN